MVWEDNEFPRSLDFDDIFFSEGDPVAESQHVFIQGNRLEHRLANLADSPFVIAECGFGFGLNFLVTSERFCELSPKKSRMHYISCEIHPVLAKDLLRFFKKLPVTLQPYANLLAEIYPQQGKGIHRLTFQHNTRHITLDLIYNHVLDAFNNLSFPLPLVDAWYLDGHAPSKNKEMWDIVLCRTIAKLSNPGTTLSTYSVAGSVRKNLQEAGFKTEKVSGFARKRHMLTGYIEHTDFPDELQTTSWSNPWSQNKQKIRSIGIIGAGLAGCATAHALAARGYTVTLIEKKSGVASGASGNLRGIVHIHPGRQLTPAGQFRMNAFQHAIRHYRVLANNAEFSWQQCGLIQLPENDLELSEYKELIEMKLYDPAFMKFVNPDQASNLANIEITYPGLFFPEAACLNPIALCKAWISSENIQLLTSHEVIGFKFKDKQWHVAISQPQKNKSLSFDALVLCNNADASCFSEVMDYPLVSNHGQTDTFPVEQDMQRNNIGLKIILRQKGYIIPWTENEKAQLTIGGSVEQGKHTAREDVSLRKKNLGLIRTILPFLHNELENTIVRKNEKFRSRAGTRCSTPDYLPLAGPVENYPETTKIFADYQRNARKEIPRNPQFLPGLFINVGHGSSGLVTTPLLAEYISSLISEEILPISKDEIAVVLPLRFLIRQLKKQKGK